MRRALATLACAAGLCAARPARAQIVNVQPLLAQGDKMGASGTAEGALDWRTGNNELLQVSGSALARYRAPAHLVFLLGRAELGRSDEGTFLNRSLGHLRYRLELLPRFQPEVFVQHDRDELRRLLLRALVGCGPRVPIVKREAIEVAAGVAYLVELERVEEGAAPGGVEETLRGRVSTYVALRATLNETFRLGHTLYVQPRADDADDVRLLVETELAAKVTEHVAVKLTPSVTFDSTPPTGVLELDTTMKTSLQISF
jgi:hypothetical protein